jgi:hypothetical protein
MDPVSFRNHNRTIIQLVLSSTYDLLLVLLHTFVMTGVNSYFVPGFGISRAVIQHEIRYHCGPDAIVRPYTHQASERISGESMIGVYFAGLTCRIGARWFPCDNFRESVDQGNSNGRSTNVNLWLSNLGTNRRPERVVTGVRGKASASSR